MHISVLSAAACLLFLALVPLQITAQLEEDDRIIVIVGGDNGETMVNSIEEKNNNRMLFKYLVVELLMRKVEQIACIFLLEELSSEYDQLCFLMQCIFLT